MDILAIHPQEPERAVFEKMPPLGMLWIAGELRKAGYEVAFYDQQVDERTPEEIVRAARPRLVLIGGTTHSRFASFAAARAVKQVDPSALVVYGGPHASFTAPDTLTHITEIDIVAHGEGEETALELAEWALRGAGRPEDLGRIRGISYRRDGQVARTPDRPPIADLDRLGPPARDLVPLDRYAMQMDYLSRPGASVVSARGCPILCTFCSAAAMFGRTYRTRTPALVVDEIEGLLAQGAEGIKIFDSTFTLSRRHVEEFCDEIKRRDLRFPWECEIRVGSVDKVLLAKMQVAGCYYIDVGIESGSQRVLDECVGKRISLGDARRTLEWARELGLLAKVFYTVGHPGETFAEGLRTLAFMARTRRSTRLQACRIGVKVYPGTQVADYAERKKLMPPGFRWSAPYDNEDNRALLSELDTVPVLIQPQLGLRELRRLRVLFLLMRSFSARYLFAKVGALLRGEGLPENARALLRGRAGTPRGPSDQGRTDPPAGRSPARE